MRLMRFFSGLGVFGGSLGKVRWSVRIAACVVQVCEIPVA